MDVENALYPTRSRIETLMADGSDEPIVMLNLLKSAPKQPIPMDARLV